MSRFIYGESSPKRKQNPDRTSAEQREECPFCGFMVDAAGKGHDEGCPESFTIDANPDTDEPHGE